MNSRNPLTRSRSCGVHWLTPEALLWSRRGVLEEIRNTPRIYVRASFTWYTWYLCVCMCVCTRKRSRQRSRFTGVLEGGATSSNQTRTELMTLSRRNFLHGIRTEIRVDSTLWRGMRVGEVGRREGVANLQGVPECSCSNLIYPRSRNFRYFLNFDSGNFFVCTEVGLGLRYYIRLFVKFFERFFDRGILDIFRISRNFYLCFRVCIYDCILLIFVYYCINYFPIIFWQL